MKDESESSNPFFIFWNQYGYVTMIIIASSVLLYSAYSYKESKIDYELQFVNMKNMYETFCLNKDFASYYNTDLLFNSNDIKYNEIIKSQETACDESFDFLSSYGFTLKERNVTIG